MLLFKACILTILIELPVMALFGMKSREDITLVVCANVLTNLSLNLLISLLDIRSTALVLALEVIVVISETLIYSNSERPFRSMLFKVFTANLVSYLSGYFLM